MASNGRGNDEFVGRYRHLGQLGLVFKHRHGSWADFGQFLKFLFSDSPTRGQGVTTPTVTCACRHNSGAWHDVLSASGQDPQAFPMFSHERYTRPCISLGAFEDKKNPGLVVADLCIKASEFLRRIGKGDARQVTGRDFDHDPTHILSSQPSVGSSQVSDSQGDISIGNIIDYPREAEVARETEAQPDLLEEDDYGDDMFGDEDVQVQLESILQLVDEGYRPLSSSSVETPSGFHASEDSIVQLVGRPTTKMRAATLGYLWQFANSPVELREQFRKLRSDSSLQVLHLCGCGICYTKPNTTVKVHGCVERSHLKLGTAVENGHHKSYHQVISFSTADNYAALCGIYHESLDGDGIF